MLSRTFTDVQQIIAEKRRQSTLKDKALDMANLLLTSILLSHDRQSSIQLQKKNVDSLIALFSLECNVQHEKLER